jgi:nitrate/nitrite-specific signal transduction histidine kinase
MRERAGLVNGAIEFAGGETGGALVRVTVPTAGGTHART